MRRALGLARQHRDQFQVDVVRVLQRQDGQPEGGQVGDDAVRDAGGPEAVGGRLQGGQGLHGQADVIQADPGGVEPVARRRGRAQPDDLLPEDEHAAAEQAAPVGPDLGVAGLVGKVHGGRRAEHLGVEHPRSRDVGHREAHVMDSGGDSGRRCP